MLQPSIAEVQPASAGSVHFGALHTRPWQDIPARQVTLQPHDRPQLKLRHDLPLQSTVQRPEPQVTLLQLCAPLQVNVQVLLPQLTPLLHEPAVEHAMLQLHPAGQVSGWLHAPLLSAQSIAQVLSARLHEVHCDGQLSTGLSLGAASTWEATQKPSMQVRPELQSDCFSHAKSPVRWLIEQAASARPTAASVASLMACPRWIPRGRTRAAPAGPPAAIWLRRS